MTGMKTRRQRVAEQSQGIPESPPQVLESDRRAANPRSRTRNTQSKSPKPAKKKATGRKPAAKRNARGRPPKRPASSQSSDVDTEDDVDTSRKRQKIEAEELAPVKEEEEDQGESEEVVASTTQDTSPNEVFISTRSTRRRPVTRAAASQSEVETEGSETSRNRQQSEEALAPEAEVTYPAIEEFTQTETYVSASNTSGDIVAAQVSEQSADYIPLDDEHHSDHGDTDEPQSDEPHSGASEDSPSEIGPTGADHISPHDEPDPNQFDTDDQHDAGHFDVHDQHDAEQLDTELPDADQPYNTVDAEHSDVPMSPESDHLVATTEQPQVVDLVESSSSSSDASEAEASIEQPVSFHSVNPLLQPYVESVPSDEDDNSAGEFAAQSARSRSPAPSPAESLRVGRGRDASLSPTGTVVHHSVELSDLPAETFLFSESSRHGSEPANTDHALLEQQQIDDAAQPHNRGDSLKSASPSPYSENAKSSSANFVRGNFLVADVPPVSLPQKPSTLGQVFVALWTEQQLGELPEKMVERKVNAFVKLPFDVVHEMLEKHSPEQAQSLKAAIASLQPQQAGPKATSKRTLKRKKDLDFSSDEERKRIGKATLQRKKQRIDEQHARNVERWEVNRMSRNRRAKIGKPLPSIHDPEPWSFQPRYAKPDYHDAPTDEEDRRLAVPEPLPEPTLVPPAKKSRIKAALDRLRQAESVEADRKAEILRKQQAEEKLAKIKELINNRMATEKDMEERYQEKEELMRIEKNEVDAALQHLIDDAMAEGRMPTGITAEEVYAVLKERRDERKKELRDLAKQKKRRARAVDENEALRTPSRPTQTHMAATEPQRPTAAPMETPRRGWGLRSFIPASINKALGGFRRAAIPTTPAATESTNDAQQQPQTAQPPKSKVPQSATIKQGKMSASKFFNPPELREDFAQNIMGRFEEHVSSLVDKRVKEELERNEAAGQVKLFVEQRVKEELAKIEEENSRKRKRGEASPSSIPNPNGDSFGINLDFFEYSSEGSPGTSPVKQTHNMPPFPETLGMKRRRLENGAAKVTKSVNAEAERDNLFAPKTSMTPKTPRKRTKEEWDAMEMYQEGNVRRRILGRETVGEEMTRRDREEEERERKAREKEARGADIPEVTEPDVVEGADIPEVTEPDVVEVAESDYAKAGDVDEEWVYLFRTQPANSPAVDQTNYNGDLPRVRRRQNVFKINGRFFKSRNDYYKNHPESVNVREGILKGGNRKGQDLVVDMQNFVEHPSEGARAHPQSKVLLDWVPVETEREPVQVEQQASREQTSIATPTPMQKRPQLGRPVVDAAEQRRQAAEQQKREQERLAKARKDAQRYAPAKRSRLGSLSTIASVPEPDEDDDVEEVPSVCVPELDSDEPDEEQDTESEERELEKWADDESLPGDEAAFPGSASPKGEHPIGFWFGQGEKSMGVTEVWAFAGL